MISIKDVHKSFSNNNVLQGVNMEIAKGESMVIIGGSGTGKSVLLKCILGLENPDSGKITVGGKEKIEETVMCFWHALECYFKMLHCLIAFLSGKMLHFA